MNNKVFRHGNCAFSVKDIVFASPNIIILRNCQQLRANKENEFQDVVQAFEEQKKSSNFDKIINEIKNEREYQNEKWGTEFDDKNTINDWGTYINIYLAKATAIGISKEEQRKMMLKVAALGVAALETFDRNSGFTNRHYD